MSYVEETFGRADHSDLIEVWREGVTWREKRLPSVWASEVRKIPAGTSPLSQGRDIPYSHDYMPHCVEQMDAADDPRIRLIAIWEGIRDGKTGSVCLNIMGRTVTDSPGNIYSVHPTGDDVHRFSNGEVEPMIDACLSPWFVDKKSRDAGRTVGFKKFTGGWLRIVSAGSITKFRGTAVKVILCHDTDALDKESVLKALGRATGFANAIKVLESTGTLAPSLDADGKTVYNSNIHEIHDQGDMRKWFGPCRKCGQLQWIKYERFWWPAGRMDKTVYLCERCDADHNEKQWREFQRNARWYPTAGLTPEQIDDIAENYKHARAVDPTIRSYWRNGFNSLLPHHSSFKSKLHEFVSEGEAAKKSPAALKTWKNEVAAELWNPTQEGEAPPDWKPLYDRREDYATDEKIVVPKKALVITVSVDVHKNRLEVLWWAWGRRQENWGILHTVLPGEVQDAAVWKDLDTELQREFDHESGAKIGLRFGLVDAGKWPEWVMFFLRHLRDSKSPVRGKIRACRGSSHYPYPIINQSYTSLVSTTRTQVSGHWIGTDAAKDLLYTRMALPEPEGNEPAPEGWMHFPESFGQTFFEQLTSERVSITFNKQNEEQRRYVKPQNVRNETLDLAVYNLAAFRLRTTYNWDAIETELLAGIPVAGKAVPQQIEKPRPKRRGQGWMNWRN